MSMLLGLRTLSGGASATAKQGWSGWAAERAAKKAAQEGMAPAESGAVELPQETQKSQLPTSGVVQREGMPDMPVTVQYAADETSALIYKALPDGSRGDMVTSLDAAEIKELRVYDWTDVRGVRCSFVPTR